MILTRVLTSIGLALTALAQFKPLSNAYEVQFRIDDGGSDHAANINTLLLSNLVPGDDFITLNHPSFPAHQVRVKKTEFCDSTVK